MPVFIFMFSRSRETNLRGASVSHFSLEVKQGVFRIQFQGGGGQINISEKLRGTSILNTLGKLFSGGGQG